MKRYIKSGRTTNRPGRKKHYKDIRFTGWTKSKTNILEALLDPDIDVKDLKQYVRFAISESEAAETKLREYRKILETLNASSYSPAAKAAAVNSLESTSLSQKDLH